MDGPYTFNSNEPLFLEPFERKKKTGKHFIASFTISLNSSHFATSFNVYTHTHTV